MELNELLEKLEIEEPSEFEYFENFAELVESEWKIPTDTLFTLFSETDADTVAEIIQQYFDDMQEGMPDDSTDIFTLIESIKMCLAGLITAGEDESVMMDFAEELSRFRTWYSLESEVECEDVETGKTKIYPLRDALTLARVDRLESTEHRFDFSKCLEYELDEYLMNFADYSEEPVEEEGESLLDSGYVYDDEMRD